MHDGDVLEKQETWQLEPILEAHTTRLSQV
jgi:hypothetical protein